MTYDRWKTDSGYDERDQEECYHEEFEIDAEDRAHCDRCGLTWRASTEEIRFQREQQAEYDAHCRRQARREFWLRLTRPIRWPIFRLLERIWPRKSLSVLADEEIPF